ncbi:MAG: hypothetical protein ACFCU3_07410 [Verrucomicrobiales bacterium]
MNPSKSEPSELTQPSCARHHALRDQARSWLESEGYTAACEVRLPSSPFRADVAGFRMIRSSQGEQLQTAVLECKVSTEDLIRDARVEKELLSRKATLIGRIEFIRSWLSKNFPEYRQGDTLFAEFDSYERPELNHLQLSRMVKELDSVQRLLQNQTKFSKMARWGLADRLVLVLPTELTWKAPLDPAWEILRWPWPFPQCAPKPVVSREECRLRLRTNIRRRLAQPNEQNLLSTDQKEFAFAAA